MDAKRKLDGTEEVSSLPIKRTKLNAPDGASASSSASSAASTPSLQELMEWKQAYEQTQNLATTWCGEVLCVICQTARPDLISYSTCCHYVCIVCVLEHTNKLIRIREEPATRSRRRRSGCHVLKAKLVLLAEDPEYSCPMCRKGTLRLMGSEVVYQADIAYWHWMQKCKTELDTSKSMVLLSAATAAAAKAKLDSHTLTLESSSLPRKFVEEAKSQLLTNQLLLERAAAAALLATQSLTAPTHSLTAVSPSLLTLGTDAQAGTQAPTIVQPSTIVQTTQASTSIQAIVSSQKKSPTSLMADLKCPFCGLEAATTHRPVEILRHVWKCKRREFTCPYTDCNQSFNWEPLYDVCAPATIDSSPQNEEKWLRFLNLAFGRHLLTQCKHRVECCVKWCAHHHSGKGIPLCSFNTHRSHHQVLERRYQAMFELPRLLASYNYAWNQILNDDLGKLDACDAPTKMDALAEFLNPLLKEVHSNVRAIGDALNHTVEGKSLLHPTNAFYSNEFQWTSCTLDCCSIHHLTNVISEPRSNVVPLPPPINNNNNNPPDADDSDTEYEEADEIEIAAASNNNSTSSIPR